MAGFSGFRAKIQISISGTWTDIGQIRDISGPSFQQTSIDISNRSSRIRQFVPGMLDNGEVTFDVVFDPDLATHSPSATGGLITELTAGNLNSYRIAFADASPANVASFSGFVTKLTSKEPQNDAMVADITLKIAGAITWSTVTFSTATDGTGVSILGS